MNALTSKMIKRASRENDRGENNRDEQQIEQRIFRYRSGIGFKVARILLILALVLPGVNLAPAQAGYSPAAAAQAETPVPPEPTPEPTPEATEDLAPEAPAAEPEVSDAPEVEAVQDDWPMLMHDPRRSGRTPATAPTNSTYYVQWAYSFGERVEVDAQPVMAGGVIYQGVMNGEMHAIDALTGKKIWAVTAGGPIPHTAAVVGGRVYFGSLDGAVYALNTTNGSKVWSFKTGGPVVSSPLVLDGLLYIGSNDGNLYALDAVSGDERWRVETGGPVVSSPAYADGRIYIGSEDLKARAVDALSGAVLWETQLYGMGMRNTHPVVSNDGRVVIFTTVKPGATSYIPAEGYPNSNINANPVDTWNTYYQARPKARTLYYLDSGSGRDLWDPGARRFVPMPIPYWGLLKPVIGPDGRAWFPAPSGANGWAYELDHDDRLFATDLSSGETTMVAGGPNLVEFQTRMDEVGRFIFAGNDYIYSSSEDLSVFHPGNDMRVLFGDGNPGYYNIGSHMAPLGRLPSLHLWRYGGAITMGGVPGGSVPIVGNSMVYYSAYSWLYAVGPTNKGLNPATSFPWRSARKYELTYPRTDALSTAQIREEVTRRVEDIIARGPDNPPMAVRWEQPGGPMQNNETVFEVYGHDFDLVRTLSEAYPFVPEDTRARLKTYLTAYMKKTLLNPQDYAYVNACIFYGEEGVKIGDEVCKENGRLMVRWNQENPNLVAQRLYGLWAYANATGDWDSVRGVWQSIVLPRFKVFLDKYNSKLGFCNFEQWRVGRLNIGAQIEAAQAVRDMAAKLGDTTTKSKASTLLNNLLNGRVTMASFVPKLYDRGLRKVAKIRLNADGTIRYEDMMGPSSPYNGDMIPYNAAERNRSTDVSQLNWWDGNEYRVDAGIGYMHYPAMSGYMPMSSQLAARLRSRLLSKTNLYVKSYEVNNPWWWMADLAYSTTGSGEHLYHSPTLSWSLFQTKARVQKLTFDVLVKQVPEPTSFNAKYDLYRLQNLVTLLDVCRLQSCKR